MMTYNKVITPETGYISHEFKFKKFQLAFFKWNVTIPAFSPFYIEFAEGVYITVVIYKTVFGFIIVKI